MDGILDINKKQVYYAVKGNGAFTYNLASPYYMTMLTTVFPKTKKLRELVVATDFPYSTKSFDITQSIIKDYYLSETFVKVVGPASLDILKNGLGEKYAFDSYNDLYFNVELRPWDIAAAMCIVKEIGCKVISLKDGKEITCNMLRNPSEKLAIAVSYSDVTLTDVYNRYLAVVNDNLKTFIEVTRKRKIAELQNELGKIIESKK